MAPTNRLVLDSAAQETVNDDTLAASAVSVVDIVGSSAEAMLQEVRVQATDEEARYGLATGSKH